MDHDNKRIAEMDRDKRIAEMNRDELRDQLIILQQKQNGYMRAMRKNFELACLMDRKKEAAEERLRTLEDWQMMKPMRGGRIHVETPPSAE